MNSGKATNHGSYCLPVCSLLLAAVLWGMLWYPLHLLADAGLNGLWTSLVAYTAVLIPSLPFWYRHRFILHQHRNSLLLLALASGWCNVAFILALLEGNVVRVVLLFYLSPVWTVLLGHLFLAERITARGVAVLCLAMSGALIMLWPGASEVMAAISVADLLALSSGLAFAVTNVTVRYTHAVPVSMKMTVSWSGVVLIACAGLLMGQASIPAVGISTWLAAAALGWFGIVIMTLSAQYGVTHLPVRRSAIIMLFEIVVTAVSAWLILGESLSLLEWCGGLLVIVAAILSAMEERSDLAD